MDRPYIHIKIKILLLTFLMPILLALFIFYSLIIGRSGVDYFVWVSVALGMLITPFFKKRRYFSSFSIKNGILEINYFSPLLMNTIFRIDLNAIKDIETTRPNYLLGFSGELNIKTASGWKSFDLIDKQIGGKLIQAIAAANTGLPKATSF